MQYYMISDRKQCIEPLERIAEEAEQKGVDYFQLREKDLSVRDVLFLAERVRSRLRRTGLIINGSLDVALAVRAEGVHLQIENIPVAAVKLRHPGLIIGYSAHSLEEMKEAEAAGADYVFISPVFPPAKPESTATPIGVEKLRTWAASVGIPVFALGGISSENVRQLQDSGCDGVAGISFFLRNGRFSFER